MRCPFLNTAKVTALLIFLQTSAINSEKAFSQDVQGWMDAFVVKPFGYFEYEGNLGTARLIEENGWRDYYFANTFSYQRVNWYLAEAALELHYTNDPQAQNIKEVTLFIGQRFFFKNFIESIHLQLPYFYLRLDERFLNYDDGTSDQKIRLRPRLGGRFILNNIFIDENTWYIPFYVEYFINFNGEAFERFAARNRVMTGVGYAFTQRLRTELNYYAQRSRNTNEESFVKSDMMFQVAVRYYFLKGTD
jgi:hypothetical protein